MRFVRNILSALSFKPQTHPESVQPVESVEDGTRPEWIYGPERAPQIWTSHPHTWGR